MRCGPNRPACASKNIYRGIGIASFVEITNPERGVLRRRRREDFVAGRRRGADGRHGFGDLPDQHHRTGAGLGIAHRADRRQRARCSDGTGAGHSGGHRQHALWRRHLGVARRRHRRRGGVSGREGAARAIFSTSPRPPAVGTGSARHRQRCDRQCRRRGHRGSN